MEFSLTDFSVSGIPYDDTYWILTTDPASNDLQNVKYQAVKISSLCYSIQPETVLSVFRSQNSTFTMTWSLVWLISLFPAYQVHTMILHDLHIMIFFFLNLYWGYLRH
jgi:hypothetical protein